MKGHYASAKNSSPVSQKRPKKVVYLTFDDGPNGATTKRIMRVLSDNDAKATFFVVGNRVKGQEPLLRRVVREGHAIGNHSWSHLDLSRVSPKRIDDEMVWTSRALKTASVATGPCFRPPYGAMNSKVSRAIKRQGLRNKLWTVDTEDWKTPPVDVLTGRIAGARSGDIVLMHDGGGPRGNTVAALARALPQLKKRGYSFAVIPACKTNSAKNTPASGRMSPRSPQSNSFPADKSPVTNQGMG